MSLKISQLKAGTIYRSRLSGLPVLVYFTGQKEAVFANGIKYGPFAVASIRYYSPVTGSYHNNDFVYDHELEEMPPVTR